MGLMFQIGWWRWLHHAVREACTNCWLGHLGRVRQMVCESCLEPLSDGAAGLLLASTALKSPIAGADLARCHIFEKQQHSSSPQALCIWGVATGHPEGWFCVLSNGAGTGTGEGRTGSFKEHLFPEG